MQTQERITTHLLTFPKVEWIDPSPLSNSFLTNMNKSKRIPWSVCAFRFKNVSSIDLEFSRTGKNQC